MKTKYETIEISPTLKAVERPDPFERGQPWWTLYVLGPKGWASVQAGPKDSCLWWDLGVTLPR